MRTAHRYAHNTLHWTLRLFISAHEPASQPTSGSSSLSCALPLVSLLPVTSLIVIAVEDSVRVNAGLERPQCSMTDKAQCHSCSHARLQLRASTTAEMPTSGWQRESSNCALKIAAAEATGPLLLGELTLIDLPASLRCAVHLLKNCSI